MRAPRFKRYNVIGSRLWLSNGVAGFLPRFNASFAAAPTGMAEETSYRHDGGAFWNTSKPDIQNPRVVIQIGIVSSRG
jgi:hypothetical protein